MSTISFRASEPAAFSALEQADPLKDLPGTWVGDGFNLIFLPDFQHGNTFRVKLNKTKENLFIGEVGAPIPDRGSSQNDIEYLGLYYTQEINDAFDNSSLHFETGLWLSLPATSSPPVPVPTIVRQASIPHGDSVLAQGLAVQNIGAPPIPVIISTPLLGGVPIDDPLFLAPLLTAVPPAGIPASAIIDPNVLLTAAIDGKSILKNTALAISTISPGSGILNIPFVTTNANATSLNAIFWIEYVQGSDGRITLQLQYTQTVILHFSGIDWPHISVATLIKR